MFIKHHTSMHAFRVGYAIMFLLFGIQNTLNSQEVISNNDGPYVFYTNDSIIVKRVSANNENKKAVTEAYPLSDKNNITLKIRFSNKRSYNFDVKLKPSIVNENPVWPQPSKLLAFSDIEGEFEALHKLLLKNKVIDKKYNWTFGNGHVVLCGDLFDRGSFVTEELWLLYKLETEAQANGGYLHIVLGNHDIMNLNGDYHYVQQKYFDNALLMGLQYDTLYSRNTELGRWLRSKNIVEKIGDQLCLHGGISQPVNELQLSLQELNKRARKDYEKPQVIDTTKTIKIDPLFDGETSPFWYRGYFVRPRATQQQVDSTLQLYDVKTIIVGHTIAPLNIASYYQNKLIAVDVNHHEGKHEAALFENGNWVIVDAKGNKRTMPRY